MVFWFFSVCWKYFKQRLFWSSTRNFLMKCWKVTIPSDIGCFLNNLELLDSLSLLVKLRWRLLMLLVFHFLIIVFIFFLHLFRPLIPINLRILFFPFIFFPYIIPTLTVIFISSFLLSFFTVSSKFMHHLNQVIHILIFFFNIWNIVIDQGSQSRKNIFGKSDSLGANKSNFFVKVAINDSHEFAEIIRLKLSDAFKVFSFPLFSQVVVNFGKHFSNGRIEEVFNSIVSPTRHVLSNQRPFIPQFHLQFE